MKRLGGMIRTVGGRWGLCDTAGSALVLLCNAYWVPLVADMLADRFLPSAWAYVLAVLVFLAVGALIVLPLWRGFLGTTGWFVAKMLGVAGSLALGTFCSLFHKTSFFFVGQDGKGHLSFLEVASLRRNLEWMASNDISFIERYHQRIAYMGALFVFAAVAVTAASLRRTAEK